MRLEDLQAQQQPLLLLLLQPLTISRRARILVSGPVKHRLRLSLCHPPNSTF